MITEEKQLLLKDLCARLPYNVVIRCTDNDTDYKCFLTTDILNELLHNIKYYDYKPYLRPMSSMTEEEYKELKSISSYYGFAPYEYISDWCPNYEMIDWLLKHHFDFRGLIEKCLALEAPKGMYKNE